MKTVFKIKEFTSEPKVVSEIEEDWGDSYLAKREAIVEDDWGNKQTLNISREGSTKAEAIEELKDVKPGALIVQMIFE